MSTAAAAAARSALAGVAAFFVATGFEAAFFFGFFDAEAAFDATFAGGLLAFFRRFFAGLGGSGGAGRFFFSVRSRSLLRSSRS